MGTPLGQTIELVRAGASVSIRAEEYEHTDLLKLVRALPDEVMLHLRDAEQMPQDERLTLARAGKKLLFEL